MSSTPGVPLAKQRSPWERLDVIKIGGVDTVRYVRRVHDGNLRAFVGYEPTGWHMSISFAPHGTKRPARYPTWDEISHARYELVPPEVTMAMLLPPPEQFVAVHPTTFHLHEIKEPTS